MKPSRLRLDVLEAGYREIAVTSGHVVAVAGLPSLHTDPFDRPLIAQAKMEGAIMLSAGAAMARYGRPVELIA